MKTKTTQPPSLKYIQTTSNPLNKTHRNNSSKHLFIYLFIFFINSGSEAKGSQTSELNHYTSQEPHGDETRKEVSVLEFGRKTLIPGKTHAIR